jgi:hypothetical protein
VVYYFVNFVMMFSLIELNFHCNLTINADIMLVLMLDLCFKKLKFIRDYVGLEMVMQITTKYDYVNFG